VSWIHRRWWTQLCSWIVTVIDSKLHTSVAYAETTYEMWENLWKRYVVCHGAITLSPKGRSDRVCSATAYKPKTLPSLIQCGTLILDILPHLILWCPCHRWDPLPTPFRRSIWRDIGVRFGLTLIPLVTVPLLFPQRASLMGCPTLLLINWWSFHFLSDVGLLSVTRS